MMFIANDGIWNSLLQHSIAVLECCNKYVLLWKNKYTEAKSRDIGKDFVYVVAFDSFFSLFMSI